MQIGFNNDVDWEGERFHIQTEDLGLSTGKITSQVFRGGAIVDTVSVSYLEHIENIEDPDTRDEEIRKRMRTLHKLCFRHIKANKYTSDAPDEPVELVEPESDDVESIDMEHTTETPALDLDEGNEASEIDGFAVAGGQEELGDVVDEKSRGEPIALDDEPEPASKAKGASARKKKDGEPVRIAAFRGLDFVEERSLPELLNELISQ